MKTIRNLFLLLAAVGLATSAQALLITPAYTPVVTTADTANPSDAQVSAAVGATVVLQYKSDVPTSGSIGNDSGPFAASYITTFTNPIGDPQDADIDWVPATPFITGNPIWLFVKDGQQAPAGYYFDISGWNGTEGIDIRGFWPDQGAISHIAIYSGSGSRVPDGGTTLVLMGFALVGLAAARRFIRA